MKSFYLATVVLMVLLSACKKENKQDSYFYTVGDSNKQYTLYIDGEEKGVLPHRDTTINSNEASQETLDSLFSLNLSFGKYEFEAKDKAGNVLMKTDVKFKSNSLSSNTEAGESGGGVEIKNSEDGRLIVAFTELSFNGAQ
jgi:hypothetical protein